MSLIDEEFTYEMRGCFFDVQNEVGFGLPEEPYHRALARAFAERGILAVSKPQIQLVHHGQCLAELYPDFIVADRIVLELKVLREDFAREHEIQLFSYLKSTQLHLGFLVNFGRERIYDWRCIFDEKPFSLKENWDAVQHRIVGHERDTLAAVRSMFLQVGTKWGFGYGEVIYWKLIVGVLRQMGHVVNLEPLAKPHFHEQALGDYPIDCAVIDNCVVVVVTAMKEGLNRFDLARAESYGKNLGLRFGAAANFGKNMLEVHGIAVA